MNNDVFDVTAIAPSLQFKYNQLMETIERHAGMWRKQDYDEIKAAAEDLHRYIALYMRKIGK